VVERLTVTCVGQCLHWYRTIRGDHRMDGMHNSYILHTSMRQIHLCKARSRRGRGGDTGVKVYRCKVSQRCRKQSANHHHQEAEKKQKEKQSGYFLPKINADATQEKGRRNEAQVVGNIMQFVKTFIVHDAANRNPADEVNQEMRSRIASLCPLRVRWDHARSA